MTKPSAIFVKIHPVRVCTTTPRNRSWQELENSQEINLPRCSIPKVAPASDQIPKADQMDPVCSKNSIECIRVYRLFKKISCGADGSVFGINGSIRPSYFAHVLDALIVFGRELVDFGGLRKDNFGGFPCKRRKQRARFYSTQSSKNSVETPGIEGIGSLRISAIFQSFCAILHL